jgi:hypothetical protein
VDGSYTNLVTGRRAATAWSPDGQHLALAESPRSGPGYKGNPNRVAEREAGDVLPSEGRLWIVRAPTALDTDLREVALIQKISLRGELRMGYGAAVIVADGQVSAGADPRRSGAAGVIDP